MCGEVQVSIAIIFVARVDFFIAVPGRRDRA
jgi:hypothetical protein